MAKILEYYSKHPNSVGVSTFQVADSEDYNIENSALAENYQTLIGSCKDDWSAKDNHALLVHAAELFWGDAYFGKENETDAQNRLNEIDVHYDGSRKVIRTTSDILKVLSYILKNMNTGPVLIPSLTLDPNSKITLTDSASTKAIKAILNNTNESTSGITWTITTSNKVNCGDFTLSPNSGANVTLSAPSKTGTANEATKGTFTLGSWSFSNNIATISANNVTGASDGATKSVSADASITANLASAGLQASVAATYTGSIAGKTLGSDNWSWSLASDKTTKSGITVGGSSKTLTLTNTTGADIIVEADTYICTNTNKSDTRLGNPQVTVPHAKDNEPYITISPTTISLTDSASSKEVTATGYNSANLSSVTWTINDTTNFAISAPTGSKTTVSLKSTTKPTGTVKMTSSTSGNTVTLSGGFTKGNNFSVTGKTLTATLPNYNSVSATVSGSIAAAEAGTYTWTWTSLPEGLTCNQSSGYTGGSITIKNEKTTTNELPEGTITVVNSNGGSTKATNTKISFDAKPVEKEYYWYVGNTDPSTMSSTSPEVSDTTTPGWRKIGKTLPSYSKNSPLWTTEYTININESKTETFYLALPGNTIVPRDGDGASLVGGAYKAHTTPTVKISEVTYYIYTKTGKTFTCDIF